MSIDDRHPEFIARIGEWIQCHDCYLGEKAVKSKRIDYLPPTESMLQDGMTTPQAPGWKDYEAYLTRAFFHDHFRDAVKAMIGIMHMKPAIIKLPAKLAPMVDKATIQGESLQMLLRRINEQQLVTGRCGLLVDAPTGVDADKALPYIAFYNAERIINWDAGRLDEGRNELELVVLDETGFQREGFTWVSERKHRILTRGIPDSLESGWVRPDNADSFAVCVKVNDMSMPIPSDFIIPSIAGRELQEIPFILIGSQDLVPEPNVPPLLGLSNLALAIYRQEADYRQTLFMQGQNTLVIIGPASDQEADLRVGAKGLIWLRTGSEAKYIGVSASGLGEMRQSLKNDQDQAAAFGVNFMDIGGAHGESGEALRVRVAARATTISQIAQCAGQGLERALRLCAEWAGEDPDEVSVQVTTDFADQNVAGAALLAFMQAKQLGLPLSLKSIHRMMQANDMTELDFEDENLQIEEEAETSLGALIMGAAGQYTDESFLDSPDPAETPGGPPSGTNRSVPITPHRRGSPTPPKLKVGKKGASTGK